MSWLDIAELCMVVVWEHAENAVSDACFGALRTLEKKVCSHMKQLVPLYTQAYISNIKACANFHMPGCLLSKTRHPYLEVTEYASCGKSHTSIKLIQYYYLPRILHVRSLSIYARRVHQFSCDLGSFDVSNQCNIRFSQCALAPAQVYWVYRQLPRLITVAYCYQFELSYVYKDCQPYFLVLANASSSSVTTLVVTENWRCLRAGAGVYRNQSYWS